MNNQNCSLFNYIYTNKQSFLHFRVEKTNMRELIIADSQDITRLGIECLSNSLKPDISSTIRVSTKRELIEVLITHPEAVVLIDYFLFNFSETNELIILRSRFPKSGWILFSDDIKDNLLKQVIYSEHPFSIILKDCSTDEISAAILLTAQSQRFICNQITSHLLTSNKHPDNTEQKLTATEQNILKEIASGKSTKEIANDRNISTHTVISHRKNIFRKLEVNSVYEATRYAIKAGLVDISDYYI